MRASLACLIGFALAVPAMTPAAALFAKNPFNDQLLKLRPADRVGALRRAVTLEDQRCGRVSANAYRGMYGNLALWSVRCVPGGDYGVFLGPDGTIQVRTCADMKALKLPVCGKLD